MPLSQSITITVSTELLEGIDMKASALMASCRKADGSPIDRESARAEVCRDAVKKELGHPSERDLNFWREWRARQERRETDA